MVMSNTQIGATVFSMVENISVSISGVLTDMVNNNIYFAEQITGNTIGTTAVSNEYLPGIISLTVGNVLGLMSAQGVGISSVKIGELSISKGMNTSSSQEWKDLGIQQIKQIGEKVSYYQCWN